MCNTHSSGDVHGVRSDLDKAIADLRDDLIEELRLINTYGAQIPVIAGEEFDGVDDVVHVLGHIRDNHRYAVSILLESMNRLETGQETASSHRHV